MLQLLLSLIESERLMQKKIQHLRTWGRSVRHRTGGSLIKNLCEHLNV